MDLGLSGKRLQAVKLEHTLVLQLSDVYFVAVSSPLTADVDGRSVQLTPEENSDGAFTPIRQLIGRVVETSRADSMGTLRITFEGGALLTVEPDPAYEAWNVSGPDGALVVSMPGGELAVWNARPEADG